MAKKIMFPLEPCILFEKKDTQWLEPMFFDAVYLNATVFATMTFAGLLSSQSNQTAGSYFTTTLQLLQERLSLQDEKLKVSDPTLMAVWTLAMHSVFVGEYRTARQHISGLRKMIELRGGLDNLRGNTKLIIEILKYVNLSSDCPSRTQ